MDKKLITSLQDNFNVISNFVDGTEIEFWYARELQKILGYDRWENFSKIIEKAKTACESAQIEGLDHFRDVRKMVTIGSGVSKNELATNCCQFCQQFDKIV